MSKQTNFSKTANNKLTVTREFDATVEQLWDAWTTSELLEQWWAPRPWRAETKSMDFRNGGKWFYAMAGPDGTKQWCLVEFNNIVPIKNYDSSASFTDEHENINKDLPTMHWHNQFSSTTTGSKVDVEITFNSEKDMEAIIAMGFKEGFTMGLGNLDELFEKRK